MKARAVWAGFYPRSPIVRGCAFHPRTIGDPRGRGAVRARGATAVRTGAVYLGAVKERPLRAARANRVFCTDEKRIRTENTVIVNTKQAVWVLYKIADCARTASRPRNKRNSTVCNLNF
jgi:hypothetical protein